MSRSSLPITDLVAAAVAAPSSHNTQPWFFHSTGSGVALVADRTRALPVNDPFDRELTISCGAALFNMEIAARHLGFTPHVQILPDPEDPDLLADVSLIEGSGGPVPGDLYDAVPRRRTTRHSFSPDAVPTGIADRLRAVGGQHAVSVHFVGGDERPVLAALVVQGDQMQFADARWRRELASWMHPRRKGEGLVVPEVVGLVSRAVVTAFDVGRSIAGKDAKAITDAPLVAIVATERDDTAQWIETGRALQHLLLTAASEDVYAGYLNQPCQVAELRPQLARLLPAPLQPQLVVRFGKLAAAPEASPRRPIEAVLDTNVGD